jgi:hypothetical protein
MSFIPCHVFTTGEDDFGSDDIWQGQALLHPVIRKPMRRAQQWSRSGRR